MTINLPAGTVTFLFTDIEGSTRLLQQLGPDAYGQVLMDQRLILRAAFDEFSGTAIDTQGDSFFASFPRASEAVAAVVQIQRTLGGHEWPEGVEVRVRMGLHTGEPSLIEEGYVGLAVHRAARIAHVGHGGQVLLSESTAALVSNDLPSGTVLKDLGEHRLKDLRTPKRIFQLDITGLPSDFPPLSGSRPNNLPVLTTPFIGRVEELAELDRLVADPNVRLITLLGPGGMGKSRLAIAAAESQLFNEFSTRGSKTPRFPHGIFFVALAPLTSSDQIVPACAEALDLPLESHGSLASLGAEARSAKQQLLDHLANKKLLLVLDNYEHLLDGAGLMIEFLEAAPGITILTTSRDRLSLQSERIFQVAGMSFPENGADLAEGYSALVLFDDRARMVRPDYDPQASDRPVTAEICRLVGGMPLAIELAAAWVEVLSLSDIAAEIRRGFGLLETDMQDVANRHRSVVSIFESTYRQLNEPEQAVFRRVSVFRAGFTRLAAEEVAGATLMTLKRLVQKSLLRFSRSKERYEIHELLRQFGAEKLAEMSDEDEVRDLHSAFFCGYLADHSGQLKGALQQKAFVELEAEQENFLAAWRWAVAHEKINRLDSALESLDFYLYRAGRDEERLDIFAQAVKSHKGSFPFEERRVFVKLSLYRASALPRKDAEMAMHIARDCLEGLEQHEAQGFDVRAEKAKAHEILFNYGDVAEEYLAQSERAIEIYRELGDLWSIAEILDSLGVDARLNTRHGDAKKFHEESINLRREIGDIMGTASSLALLSMAENTLGNYVDAEKLARKSLAISRQSNHIRNMYTGLYALAWSLTWQGRNRAAREAALEIIQILENSGLYKSYSNTYTMLGLIEADLGLYESAEANGRIGLEMGRANKDLFIEAFARYLLGRLALVNGDYVAAEDLLKKALAVFTVDQDLGPDTQSTLGALYHILGNSEQASRLYGEVVGHFLANKFFYGAHSTLPKIALLFLEAGDIEYALELQALAETAPHVANSQWMYDLFGSKIKAATKGLPPETITAAQARGQARDLWKTVEELLEILGK